MKQIACMFPCFCQKNSPRLIFMQHLSYAMCQFPLSLVSSWISWFAWFWMMMLLLIDILLYRWVQLRLLMGRIQVLTSMLLCCMTVECCHHSILVFLLLKRENTTLFTSRTVIKWHCQEDSTLMSGQKHCTFIYELISLFEKDY